MAKWYEDPLSMAHTAEYAHTFGRDLDIKGAQRYGWSVTSSQTRHDRIKRGNKYTTKITYVVRFARTPVSKAQADVARSHEGLDAAHRALAAHSAEFEARERRFSHLLDAAHSRAEDPIKLERALADSAKHLAAQRAKAQKHRRDVRGSISHAQAMHAQAARLGAPVLPPPFDLDGEGARIDGEVARHAQLLPRDKELVAAQVEVVLAVRDWQETVGARWRAKERPARLEARLQAKPKATLASAAPAAGDETSGAPTSMSTSMSVWQFVRLAIPFLARPEDLARQRQEAERLDRVVAARREALERVLAVRDDAWAAVVGELEGDVEGDLAGEA